MYRAVWDIFLFFTACCRSIYKHTHICGMSTDKWDFAMKQKLCWFILYFFYSLSHSHSVCVCVCQLRRCFSFHLFHHLVHTNTCTQKRTQRRNKSSKKMCNNAKEREGEKECKKYTILTMQMACSSKSSHGKRKSAQKEGVCARNLWTPIKLRTGKKERETHIESNGKMPKKFDSFQMIKK